MGGNVAIPVMDERYDLIVTNSNGGLFRVQCKSASVECPDRSSGQYSIHASRSKTKDVLTTDDADILAVYIIPEDCWFFMLIEDVSVVTMRFNPSNPSHKFNKYKENWGIFNLK